MPRLIGHHAAESSWTRMVHRRCRVSSSPTAPDNLPVGKTQPRDARWRFFLLAFVCPGFSSSQSDASTFMLDPCTLQRRHVNTTFNSRDAFQKDPRIANRQKHCGWETPFAVP